ncbi:hypothetical protein [Mesorhizobium sp. SP-1A]|jgi:hypothetical protein|uniref:hypothetical protein n=1 Tax=Mesorhizobium sp. SP-1A TaxID=3077840 RepID=UPI0028F73A65|nr:hypothetical protein [Mesorhizobium sp. SP-1A]
MQKPVNDRGLFRPPDLARLQRAFDEACRCRGLLPDSPEARDMALTLLALHTSGVTDERRLLEALLAPPPDAMIA